MNLPKISRSPTHGAVFLALTTLACGEGFDPPEEIKTLRVLGVQKTPTSYPSPGETVHFNLLWHDPAGRDAKVYWVAQDVDGQLRASCTNPPGDLFQACLPGFLTATPIEAAEVDLTIDPEVLSSRPVPSEGQAHYGLSYVFFVVCAGDRVEPDPTQLKEGGSIPLKCMSGDTQIGPEGFVVGYTALYTFEGIANQNPALTGFEVGDNALSACHDADCISGEAAPEIDCASPDENPACIPACAEDGDASCPEIPLRPVVTPDLFEKDAVSKKYYMRDVEEQQWINYYVDRGSLRSGVRLLNDAQKGFNEDFGTDFFAPKEPGPVTIWAVAHDNRGGTSWTRTHVQIF